MSLYLHVKQTFIVTSSSFQGKKSEFWKTCIYHQFPNTSKPGGEIIGYVNKCHLKILWNEIRKCLEDLPNSESLLPKHKISLGLVKNSFKVQEGSTDFNQNKDKDQIGSQIPQCIEEYQQS